MEYDETPETAIVGSCLSLLAIMGIYAWRNNTGALFNKAGRMIRYGLKGSSDIIGILPDGRFLAVECKTSKGKASPAQVEFIKNIKANNGVGMIVRSPDELLAKLKEEKCVK